MNISLMELCNTVTQYFNILFILFSKEDSYTPKNTVNDGQSINVPSDECIVKHKPAHMEKRLMMYKTFGQQFDEFPDYTFPIAKITFAISVLIASDQELRMRFFAAYDSPVPGITQFLIDIFRIGQLPDGTLISGYGDSKEYLEYLENLDLNIRYSFLYTLKDYKYEYNVMAYVIWFNQLNRIDNCGHSLSDESDFYFRYYAPLIKTPSNSEEILYFPGLTFQEDSIFWFQESNNLNQVLKNEFLLIAAALNTCLCYEREKFYNYPINGLVYGKDQPQLLEIFLKYILLKGP